MTRNLVFCLDGTWNRADAPCPTNVVLTRRAAGAADADQLVFYDPGVGTGRFDRIRGGVVGLGLALNVEEAYRRLCQHYRPGDLIFLFGYSRGAYTARSLAGLVGLCGIQSDPDMVGMAPEVYRMKPGAARAAAAKSFRAGRPREIDFLGVWDTVGALGVPIDGLRWIGARRFNWHDVRIGPHIHAACHLVAIDERRKPFAPSLWTGEPVPGQIVEQIWLPGVHGDVGGGRDDIGLSNRSLNLMWDRARKSGLHLDPGYEPTEPPIGECRPGDSMTAPYLLFGAYRRPIGERRADGRTVATGETIHRSAVDLLQSSPSYRDGRSGRAIAAAIADGVPVAA